MDSPSNNGYRAYAGIGSRGTPLNILRTMANVATRLEELGFTLRSGGADGADSAFEAGVKDPANKKIYLPWNGYNGRRKDKSQGVIVGWPDPQTEALAMQLARQHHPAWERCSPGAQRMHARNGAQILGSGLNTPSKFVVCWTEGGLPKGGTGQALRLANALGIPVFNLGEPDRQKVLVALGNHIESILNQGQ